MGASHFRIQSQGAVDSRTRIVAACAAGGSSPPRWPLPSMMRQLPQQQACAPVLHVHRALRSTGVVQRVQGCTGFAGLCACVHVQGCICWLRKTGTCHKPLFRIVECRTRFTSTTLLIAGQHTPNHPTQAQSMAIVGDLS